MNPKVKKAFKIISNTVLGFVVALALLLYGPQCMGLKPYSVLSGSMQSVYPTGSLLYIRDVKPETLEVGDVITFKMNGGTICTHRIIELVQDKDDTDIIRFRTKGDENLDADTPLVSYENVVGKAVFCIPLLGYLATYIAIPPWKYIAITVAIAIILVEIMISLVLDDDNEKQSKKAKN